MERKLNKRPHRFPAAALRWFADNAWFGPAVLAGLFMIILAALLSSMQRSAVESQRREMLNQARTAQEHVRNRLETTQHYLNVLGEDLSRGAIEAELLRQRAASYVRNHPELRAVLHCAPGLEVRWAVPAAPNRELLGQKLTLPASEAADQRARETGSPTYTRPYAGIQGGNVFQVHIPLDGPETNGGSLIGLYSCEGLLRHALPRPIIRQHQVSLVGRGDKQIVALPAGRTVSDELVTRIGLDPPGHGLGLRLARYAIGAWSPGTVLMAGLCTALVLGMAWGMWAMNRNIAHRRRAEEVARAARNELEQRVRQRTADLEQANQQLQSEIVERQRAEEKARRHMEQLAHVSRLSTMGELAASLAHELNQPLGAITGYAQGCARLVEANRPDLDEFRRASREIATQARRAGRIIHRLRDFVSQNTPQRVNADVNHMSREVAALLDVEIRHHQIEMEYRFSDPLPAVLADPTQLQQVLLNLMRNAIEAMRDDGTAQRQLMVRTAKLDDDRIEVAVSDTGPGCSSKVLQQACDPFFTTKQGGMGMGLAISRSIVEAHGGRLWAIPNHERGITICFTLPVERPKGEES